MASPSFPAYITMCAIVKNEDQYVEEWVLFHLAAGVDHILLIENAPYSTLPIVLGNYIREGLVEVWLYPGENKPQREAYNRALRYMQGKTRWLGFFDIDEFVYPTNDESLKNVLKRFEDFAGLAVNWVSYGSNGHADKPAGWVTKNFTDRGEINHAVRHANFEIPSTDSSPKRYRAMNSHVKCFVDPARTHFFRTAHHYRYKEGSFAVTENRKPIHGPYSDSVSIEQIRCNHYWSKSIQELEEKLAKGRVSQKSRSGTSGYDLEYAREREVASSGVKDSSALHFAERAAALKDSLASTPPARDVSRIKRLRYSPADWMSAILRSVATWIRRRLRWATKGRNQ